MPIVEVETSEDFDIEAEQWGKKYRRLPDIIERLLIDMLEQGERPGDKIPGVGDEAYKFRPLNPDPGRRASRDLRGIYVQLADRVVLLTIYRKSQRENISTTEIRRIINRLKK